MHSPTSSSWHGLKAILDTGAGENWISKEACDRLKLPTKKGLYKVMIDIKGKTIPSTVSTDVTWCLAGQGKTNVSEFRVAEGPTVPFDVLFGHKIISSEEFYLDQQTPVLVIAGKKGQVCALYTILPLDCVC
jgi:hypothetical protein